jgi:SAM-dependent methyltransferase
VAWIAERAGLRPGATVVDVGAGTGKLTRLLVPTGARVIAVEPVPAMRSKLMEAVPAAEALDGTAEALPLSDRSADAITAAQAFHWFDLGGALPEVHRVLRPGGTLVLVWNMRDLGDPVHARVEDLLAAGRTALRASLGPHWRPVLEASGLFGAVEERTFRFEESVTADELRDRVASTSFVAAMEAGERERFLARVRAVADGLVEPFPLRYVTEVYVIPRSSDPGREGRGTPFEG